MPVRAALATNGTPSEPRARKAGADKTPMMQVVRDTLEDEEEGSTQRAEASGREEPLLLTCLLTQTCWGLGPNPHPLTHMNPHQTHLFNVRMTSPWAP